MPVELRDAERQLGHGPEPRQLPPAAPTAVGHARVDAGKVLGWRDVVVDEGAPVRQAPEEAGDLRSDGEVKKYERVGRGHLPVARVEVGVLGQAGVPVLGVYVGGVAPA